MTGAKESGTSYLWQWEIVKKTARQVICSWMSIGVLSPSGKVQLTSEAWNELFQNLKCQWLALRFGWQDITPGCESILLPHILQASCPQPNFLFHGPQERAIASQPLACLHHTAKQNCAGENKEKCAVVCWKEFWMPCKAQSYVELRFNNDLVMQLQQVVTWDKWYFLHSYQAQVFKHFQTNLWIISDFTNSI